MNERHMCIRNFPHLLNYDSLITKCVAAIGGLSIDQSPSHHAPNFVYQKLLCASNFSRLWLNYIYFRTTADYFHYEFIIFISRLTFTHCCLLPARMLLFYLALVYPSISLRSRGTLVCERVLDRLEIGTGPSSLTVELQRSSQNEKKVRQRCTGLVFLTRRRARILPEASDTPSPRLLRVQEYVRWVEKISSSNSQSTKKEGESCWAPCRPNRRLLRLTMRLFAVRTRRFA